MTTYERTWPIGIWRKARKPRKCNWVEDGKRCQIVIEPGEKYFDPGESNPDVAGGFGGYAYCNKHNHNYSGAEAQK